MSRGRLLFATCLLALGLAACDRSDPPPRPLKASAPVEPEPQAVQVFFKGPLGQLEGYLWKPTGAVRHPAIVYNHGSEKSPTSGTASGVGPFFAKHGMVVFFPNRRGTGHSEGPFWNDRVSALPKDKRAGGTVDALVADNDDVVAAIEWLREQPFVDRKSIAVAGCSFGGIEALLTAEKPLDLWAALDFAGGAQTWAQSPALQARMKGAAEHAKVPVFFLQAQNDYDTTPSTALSEVMRLKQLPYRVKIYPPFGTTPEEGHAKFCRSYTTWGPDVLDFLKNRK